MEKNPWAIGILDISIVKRDDNHMSAARKEDRVLETIQFNGHPNILGTHGNTIEVTKVAEISKRADCIIGVNASKACSDLGPALRKHIQAGGQLAFEIRVGEASFKFKGKGGSELELSDPHELVLRRSDFVSSRTAAISCDAAALDVPREMIKLLQDNRALGALIISALEPDPSSEEISVPLFIES
ncbi:MAG: DUF371 domain-containing protein [Nitrososphaerales archaeon]